MSRSMISLMLGLFLCPVLPLAAEAQSAITEQDARAIAVDAYVYLYPLVTMEVTRKLLTNVEPGKGIGAPMNVMFNVPAFPAADMKRIARPDFDTLSSIAYLDLTKGPMIVSVPDTGGRYYLLPMLDMWSDVFASPGWRTTGTQAANFLVTPRGWSGTVPAGFTQIEAPTSYVWIAGRTRTNGPSDYDAVHKIQAGYKITPLSEWNKPASPVVIKIDPSVDMKTPPKIQVDTMSADKYFSYAAELLKLHPPHITDQPIIAQMKRIGIEPGQSFDISKVNPVLRKALEDAPAAAQKLMGWKVPTIARVVNHWSMTTDTIGAYGNYYLKRAVIAGLGLGASLPEDAIYPSSLTDEAGNPLDGANNYTIHFDKGALPPVNAFWSLTLYDREGFQVANSLDRFALNGSMPFKYNPDGALDLYVQSESPGTGKEANWLPAPKAPFNLTMRLYSPKSDALTGQWNPPPVIKVEGSPSGVTANPFPEVTGPRPFLIIAPDEFMAALQPLVAHKNSTGMPTLAVSIGQLTSHFAGADDPEKIKRGIQYAYEHLGVEYVMLVGDPHWFPVRFIFFKNFSRSYPNHPNEPNLPVDGVYAPSDLYYANLYHHKIVRSPKLTVSPGPFDDWDADHNGYYNEADWGPGARANWNNPNPDRVDGYPDIVVARANARSVADVMTYVSKIIRYETQRPKNLLFTFVADGIYRNAPRLVDPIVANSRLNYPSAFLQINKPDGTASARWVTNASPEDVANKINSSVWVGYLGHGSLNSWDGRGFGLDLVKLTANNDALPIVFTDGCVTGRFAIEAPFDSEYLDVAGAHHKFAPAPGADPKNPSIPAMVDNVSGQKWGANCADCNPLPLIAPKPNPYDFDRASSNFAYPWLFSYPQGGAIAYFGEIGVMEPQMAAELETYMLTEYVAGQRNLGAIYLRAERKYWEHHVDDPGIIDHHSPSRLYLGFMVMFGDPSLRTH